MKLLLLTALACVCLAGDYPYDECRWKTCCNTGCIAGSCNGILHERGYRLANFWQKSQSYCTWKFVNNKRCCRSHDRTNDFRVDGNGVCPHSAWLALPQKSGGQLGCAQKCVDTHGCSHYSYCHSAAPYMHGQGKWCRDPSYRDQCLLFRSCGSRSTVGQYSNFYTYKLKFVRNDYDSLPAAPQVSAHMDWRRFMAPVNTGVCTGGFIRSDQISPATLNECKLRCLNNLVQSCRYIAWCPASAGCSGGASNRCALYTASCGTVATSGGIDWDKYTLYKMNDACAADPGYCLTMPDASLIHKIDWPRYMPLEASSGVCSGGYMHDGSGQITTGSLKLNECKMRCYKRYDQGCRHVAFCGDGCTGSRANRCALYTANCGTIATDSSKQFDKYSVYKVNEACGKNPASCYRFIASSAIAPASPIVMDDDDLIDIDDLFVRS